MLEVAAVVAGFALLVWAGDKFVLGAAGLAKLLGVAPIIIGMVIVGFGTSAPEMLVSAIAAWDGSSGLAVGNAIGSNITNIALVLGATVLIAPLAVHSKLLRREYPVLFIINIVALLLLLDQRLDLLDGIVLLIGLFLFVMWMIKLAKSSPKSDPLSQEIKQEMPKGVSLPAALLWLAVGLVLLSLGARLVVWGGEGIARALGVSDLVIGLTIVAIGTSLPELVASIMSARKNEHDLALGNIIGSNMFNLLGVLGIAAVIHPATIEAAALYRDFPVMIFLTLVLIIMSRSKAGPEGTLTRTKGSLLLTVYILYMIALYLSTKAAA